MNHPTTTVIIPTYNRPDDLAACIRSLLAQSLRPNEMIVIEDGQVSEFPLRNECEAAGIRCVYEKKEVPGLTASRNLGISLATGAVIFFLDDDVVLYPDYLHEIMRIYHEYDQDGLLGGVGGLIANSRPLKLDNVLFFPVKVLFMTSGLREGKILPSGFCVDFFTTPFPLKKPAQVDFLSGGVSSFKRTIFEEFQFSDQYRGYGLGEDKEFTWRVAQKYRLYINPAALLDHNESPVMRYDKYKMGRAFVLFSHKFFSSFLDRGRLSRVCFWYGMLGYLVERTLIMLAALGRRGEGGRVRGILSALGEVWQGTAKGDGAP